MDIKNLKVGDTIYCKLVGNEERRVTKEKRIQEWEITKIGRKYLTAKAKNTYSREIQFDINRNFRQNTNCCVDYELYETRQEIEDEIETKELNLWFLNSFHFANSSFSLEKLRKAKEILTAET